MKAKSSSKKTVIISSIISLVVGALLVIPFAISNNQDTELPFDSSYNSDLKRAAKAYQTCIEHADQSLDSPIEDKMEGTQFNRENIAQTDREMCTRKYESQLRRLNNGN